MASPRESSARASRASAQSSGAELERAEDVDAVPEMPEVEEEREQDADLPLTMAASVVLTSLPKDAHEALEAVAKEGEGEKVKIRVLPLGAAQQLRQNLFTLPASKRFETVLVQLRKRVRIRESDGLFCYIHQSFSPAPDEGIGNLHRSFKIKDELVVHYAITPAYG